MSLQVKVVYHRITKKLYSFYVDERTSEIIITSDVEDKDYDDLIVSSVDPRRLDLFDGYLLDEGVFYGEE